MQDQYPDDQPDLQAVVVKAMFNSVATFQDSDDGHAIFMEVRAITLDDQEHHLLIPITGAIPMLESIMHTAMAALGKPNSMGSIDVPDDPNDIDWTQQ